MRQSQLFTKTLHKDPKDEVSRNAQLLMRGGFIYKEMAGVYTYLPLGLRVLNNIEKIIREEMNAIGGQELLMTTLQDPNIWKQSGRWDDAVVDNWFKTTLANGAELGIANTHEEPLVALLTHYVDSYKDLPLYIYQFQTKFRNELRAKSGIMRVREFLMKDLYSFSASESEFKEFYELCAAAYMKIFARVGLGDYTYRTVAAGGSFTTDFTDEFQTLSEAGEDTIYIDTERKFAVNKEVYTEETIKKLGLEKSTLKETTSIEVGNIFPLGTKYSEALGLYFKDQNGAKHPIIMGSYGIGLGRLMGAIAEVFCDQKGIVWPEQVAPFRVHLLAIGESDEVLTAADALYKQLHAVGCEVFYDDRKEKSAGEKFTDADLIGIPWRAVISDKTVSEQRVELKNRSEKNLFFITREELLQKFSR